MTAKKKKKNDCQAGTELCSGELMATYGVNGSEKQGEVFKICGACAVMIRRGGSKLKQMSPEEAKKLATKTPAKKVRS